MKKKPWWRQKTTLVAIGMILGGIAGIMQGTLTAEVGIHEIVAGIIAVIALAMPEKEGE